MKTMKTYENSLAPRFRQRLARREGELRALLRTSADPADNDGEAGSHEVMDFKDIATEESLAVVDEAQANHAAAELEQVLAALRRLDDRTYGRCLDCGKDIDLRRLEAMPATPFCTACQSVREQARPAATQP